MPRETAYDREATYGGRVKGQAQPDSTREAKPDSTREAKPDSTREAQPDSTREAQPDSTREAQPDWNRQASRVEAYGQQRVVRKRIGQSVFGSGEGEMRELTFSENF